MKQRNDELAEVQKIIRSELHAAKNYWDYLIDRMAGSPDELTALYNSSKETIARLFVNRYL